jgi:hypothetical protein
VASFLGGIIEGFYGVSWTWAERLSSVEFLRDCGLNTYIYAPKSDGFLRRHWDQPWPEDEFGHLLQLADTCRANGVQWGVGLSPMEAYIGYGPKTLERLRSKLAEINRLQPDILCILFDDMRGDIPGLAGVQARIVNDIAAMSSAPRLVMCPTYYSDDPVLERVFGPMPSGYWQELGRQLDPAIDFFWTGNRVCSTAFSRESLAPITAAMGRAPVLWDNYPVNDGAKMSRKLHLKPFVGRPADIASWTHGHLANPMNQACLSRIALCTSPACGQPLADLAQAVEYNCPRDLTELLLRDAQLFTDAGLDAMREPQREQLAGEYSRIDHACAREVAGWLRGDYAFDPACLTD